MISYFNRKLTLLTTISIERKVFAKEKRKELNARKRKNNNKQNLDYIAYEEFSRHK